MALASSILALMALALTRQWGITRTSFMHSSAIGLTLHAAYLGGCFYAVSIGMPAGITALIVSVQPVFVSIFASIFLGERMEVKRIAGLVLGLSGIVLVLAPRITGVSSDITTRGVIACVVGLLGGTLGTLLQKKYGAGIPMLAGAAVQYLMTALVIGLIAIASEKLEIRWTGQFIFGLLWLVFALSVGAILLLFFLLKNSSAASVSSLYYLVPPVTAVMAFLLFGEQVSPMAMVGTAITVTGVWLVTSQSVKN